MQRLFVMRNFVREEDRSEQRIGIIILFDKGKFIIKVSVGVDRYEGLFYVPASDGIFVFIIKEDRHLF